MHGQKNIKIYNFCYGVRIKSHTSITIYIQSMNRLVVVHKYNRSNLINNWSYINLGYLTTLSFYAIL